MINEFNINPNLDVVELRFGSHIKNYYLASKILWNNGYKTQSKQYEQKLYLYNIPDTSSLFYIKLLTHNLLRRNTKPKIYKIKDWHYTTDLDRKTFWFYHYHHVIINWSTEPSTNYITIYTDNELYYQQIGEIQVKFNV